MGYSEPILKISAPTRRGKDALPGRLLEDTGARPWGLIAPSQRGIYQTYAGITKQQLFIESRKIWKTSKESVN